MHGKGEEELERQTSLSVRSRENSIGAGSGSAGAGGASESEGGLGRKKSGRRIRDFVKGLTSSGNNEDAVEEEDDGIAEPASSGNKVDAIEPKADKPLKRVLYTANVGDARAVLSYV
jgi:protein phosphatase PTC1